jgi:fermentation-respiration switch protein FrsA (DUF1100 family)
MASCFAQEAELHYGVDKHQRREKMKSVTFPNAAIKMAGNLHLPKDFSKDRRYRAIVCVHPAGGVKEQTAGLYAAKLADEGFVALAYDASYQGVSSGEPRQEEDPYARVEDIRAAVDYLTTVEFVDQQRICVLGICSGGGYAINAAMTDPRIKAVGTVSAINLGGMYRAGYHGTVADMSQTFTLLEMATKARTAEAKGERMGMLPFAPQKREVGQAPDNFEAWEYDHTPRAPHPNAPSIVPVHSLARLIGDDAFHLADQLLTQPLRIIAGSKAGSLWFSQDAFRRAGSRDKNLHIVEGATHIAMYDTPEYVKQAMAQLVPLYQNAGKSSSASNFVGPLSAHAATNVAKSASSPG